MFRPSWDSDLGRDVAVQHFHVYSVCLPVPNLTVLKHFTQIEKYMKVRGSLNLILLLFTSSPTDTTHSAVFVEKWFNFHLLIHKRLTCGLQEWVILVIL